MTRPKVTDWLDGDNKTLLVAWARNGLTDQQLADNMGINISTLYKWKNKNSEFSDILKRTKEVVDIEVENALYKAAISGNTTAMIFWLKNRNRKAWKDKQEEFENDERLEKGGIVYLPAIKDE